MWVMYSYLVTSIKHMGLYSCPRHTGAHLSSYQCVCSSLTSNHGPTDGRSPGIPQSTCSLTPISVNIKDPNLVSSLLQIHTHLTTHTYQTHYPFTGQLINVMCTPKSNPDLNLSKQKETIWRILISFFFILLTLDKKKTHQNTYKPLFCDCSL